MKEDVIYPTMVIRSQAETIELLEKENKKLQTNWKELKKYLKETLKKEKEWCEKHNCEWKGYNAYTELLNKMQEIESGNNE